MRLFIYSVLFISGNFLYQLFYVEPNWAVATERAVFQVFAIVFMYCMMKTQHADNHG